MELSLGPLCIRSFRPDDAGPLARLANDPRVAAGLTDAFPHPYRREHAEAWIRACAADDPELSFAIAGEAGFMGGIGLKPRGDVFRVTTEVGFWLGEPFWGRGIMSRVVPAFVAWTFRRFPEVARIEAQVYGNNPASARVLEKSGFEREARLKRAVLKNGELLDLWIFAAWREG